MHQNILLKLKNIRLVPSFEYVGYNFNLKKKKKKILDASMFRSLRKAQKWSKAFCFVFLKK